MKKEQAIMNFELKDFDLAAAAAHKSDALLLLVPSAFKASSGVLSDLVRDALKAGDLEQKVGRHLALYRHAGVATPRVLLVPCEDASPRNVRRAVAAGLKAVKSPSLRKLLLCFAAPVEASALRVAVACVAEGTYAYTTTKSKKEGRTLAQLTVACPGAASLRADFDAALAEIEGVEFAKEWANRPANHATPTMLAGAAQSLVKAPRIQCEVLGPRQVAKLGMGSFMAVAQGSEEDRCASSCCATTVAPATRPVVLVGKGITFDTGGISIKPAPEMDEMKFDMGGAASVLGVFKALSVSKPAINVVGLIPAARTCRTAARSSPATWSPA
jgi:leucyl aminopeptidase